MYDICIIGSGPGGYTAALQAANRNLKVCLIEKDLIGGVCLNRGCIPTKSLLYSAKILSLCSKASEFGVNFEHVSIDYPAIISRKNNIVTKLRSQLEVFLKSRKIELVQGEAELVSEEEIKVKDRIFRTKNIILANGSSPKEITSFKFDHSKIISSDDILQLDEVPQKLLIIGAGAIGCEFANIFASFGSRVTLVEMFDEILPSIEKEISSRLRRIFEKNGIVVFTKKDASELNFGEFDKILISAGRQSNMQIKGLSKLGVKFDKNISADKHCRTNISNIFCIGDCNGLSLLAHSASHQGRISVENILGSDLSFDALLIPNCVYTNPQIACVGLNEEQAKLSGKLCYSRKFMFSGLGKANIIGETEGFLKMTIDKSTDEILGASMIGPDTSEIISSLTLAISRRLTLSQLKEAVYAHPTLSEIISEAAYY